MMASTGTQQDVCNNALYFLTASGTVAELIRRQDWARSSLGVPSSWEPELQALVGLMLNTPTPAFIAWGPKLVLLYNDAYLSILGNKHPSSLGMPLPEVWPEIWPDIMELIQTALEGRPVSFEDLPFVICRSGRAEQAWFSFTYSPVHIGRGKVGGIYCALQETTAKVLAEQKRKEHELALQDAARSAEEGQRKLTALLEAAPVGIAFADADGRVIASSRENQRIWGAHPFSQNVNEYREWKGWWADGSERHGKPIRPEDWGLARALRGEEVANEVVEVEPFGEPGTRKTLLLRASPVRRRDGQIMNAVVAQVDITESVRATAALQESEAKFEAITNAMPQMVWTADAKGNADYYNQEWYDFTGCPPDAAMGDGWGNLVHPNDQEAVAERWSHSVRSGSPYEAECRLRHHSGQYRWVLVRARPVRDKTGRVNRWMGTSTDIHEKKQTEAELLDARLRLQAALTAADLGTWTWDIENDRVFADTNVARLFDVPKDVANGGPAAEYLAKLHPNDVESSRARLQHSIESGEAYRDSYRVRRPDGRYRYIEARGKVERDQAGNPKWLPGVAIDVTSQMQAEEALARSETKLRYLAGSGVIGVVEYKVSGELKYVNDAFLNILGYTREEFERDGLSWRKLTPPDWLEENEKVIQQLRGTGRMEKFVKEYFRKDGTRATVYVGAANFEGTDEEGIAYILDISDLKKAERSLQESEAKFRAITDAMPQIVWSADANGAVDYCNQRWYDFSGAPAGTTLGHQWTEAVHPDDKSSVLSAWLHCVSCGEPFALEYRLKDQSDEYRWVLGRAVPVRDDRGGVTRWMGTCTEIQEQKLAQERLQEADRQKDEFLAMLAHELRNPLAPILSAGQLLTLGMGDEQKVKEIGQVVSRQAEHMTGLIHDLLDVSRVTRGMIELERDPVRVSELVAETVEQMRPVMKAKGHQLELHLSSEDAWVCGDRKRLVQVLANLLGNASRYTPGKGNIVLQTVVTEVDVKLMVCDNGIGMSRELQARAFDLFAQGERQADRAEGGLGIGLALVKKLTELHNGGVEAKSDGPGLGSEFTVRLPRLPVQEKSAKRADAPVSLPPINPVQVLVVDDNLDAANVLALYIEAVGHKAAVETSPTRALQSAAKLLPRVCLLDIGLPEFSGYVLAQRMRAIPGMRDALLIAATGYGQPEDRERALSAGFDHHLVKPIDGAALLRLIGTVQKRES